MLGKDAKLRSGKKQIKSIRIHPKIKKSDIHSAEIAEVAEVSVGQVSQTLRQGIWFVRISVTGTRRLQRHNFQRVKSLYK